MIPKYLPGRLLFIACAAVSGCRYVTVDPSDQDAAPGEDMREDGDTDQLSIGVFVLNGELVISGQYCTEWTAKIFAVNTNSIPGPSGPLVDSDGDGLDDALENDDNLNPLDEDTDGDLFSDFLELSFSNQGFNPTDPDIPNIDCVAADDADGDGLRGCEERFYNTDPGLPDSDGDGLPDGIEPRFGLNPSAKDTLVDHDFDGATSGDEVIFGSHPNDADSAKEQIVYSVQPGEEGPAGTTCYYFTVTAVPLVETQGIPPNSVGEGINRILVFTVDEPFGGSDTAGSFRVACIEAPYPEDIMSEDGPVGLMEGLSDEHFADIATFNPERDCLK